MRYENVNNYESTNYCFELPTDIAPEKIATLLLEIEKSSWESFDFERFKHQHEIIYRLGGGPSMEALDLINRYKNYTTRKWWEKSGAMAQGGNMSERDKLFSILLFRLDICQRHRKTFVGIVDSSLRNPSTFFNKAAIFSRTNNFILSLASIPLTGISGLVAKKSLAWTLISSTHTWRDDHSPDLSATLDCINQNLNRFF